MGPIVSYLSFLSTLSPWLLFFLLCQVIWISQVSFPFVFVPCCPLLNPSSLLLRKIDLDPRSLWDYDLSLLSEGSLGCSDSCLFHGVIGLVFVVYFGVMVPLYFLLFVFGFLPIFYKLQMHLLNDGLYFWAWVFCWLLNVHQFAEIYVSLICTQNHNLIFYNWYFQDRAHP